MRNEPAGLTKTQLSKALSENWNIDAPSLDYAPVGFGSYHWQATDASGQRWFLTANDLTNAGVFEGPPDAVFAALDAAMETNALVLDAGLEFALAPVGTTDGDVLVRVSKEWCVAVFPYIEDAQSGPGEWDTSPARNVAAGLVGRLHAASPPPMVGRWTPAFPHRSALEAALDDLARPWTTGPYAEPTRLLLADAQSQLQATLAAYDRLADAVVQSSGWVVTHGEPHSANFITGPDGQMSLIDWDTALLAPRERDLWIVVGDDPSALAAYERKAGAYRPDPRAMELFRVRWLLADAAVYVRGFRSAHDDSPDDRTSWDGLSECVQNMKERPVDA